MKKIIIGVFAATLFIFSWMGSAIAYADTFSPMLNIVPASTTPIGVYEAGAPTTLNYTVTNNSTEPAYMLTINPGAGMNTQLVTAGVTNDTCSGQTLPLFGSQCTFTATVAGKGGLGSTTLAPQVCKSNGALCSIPVLTNRVPVTIHGGNTSISVHGSYHTSAVVGSGSFGTLSVKVVDGSGAPLGGVLVTFTAPSSGASGTFQGGVNTAVTDPTTGIATSAAFTANTVAGAYAVTALTPGALSPATFNLTNTAGTATTIVATSGSNQNATVSSSFAKLLVATVVDTYGNPVPGVAVNFACNAVGGSCGTFSANSVTTNSSGVASVTMTANAVPTPTGQTYTVTAFSTDVTFATFTGFVNTVGPAVKLAVVSGNSQNVMVGTAAQPFVVQLQDADNNAVSQSGVSVVFTAPSTGPSGTFANATNTTTVQTNASGQATAGLAPATTFTANDTIGGPYSVTAASGSLQPASFSLTNIANSGITITPTGGDAQSVPVTTDFLPLSATVLDGNSRPVAGVTVTFTVNPGADASASFAGNTAVTAVTNALGVAVTATTLTANTKTGAFTVVASASSVTTNTGTFNLSNIAGPAALMVITTPCDWSAATSYPSPCMQNQEAQVTELNFPNALGITVTDQYGNGVANQSVTFTVNPVSGASGTFLENGNTQIAYLTDGTGVIAGPTLVPNLVAGTYSVTAAIPSSSVANAVFRVTNLAGDATSIAINPNGTPSSPQTVQILQDFAPFSVIIKDAAGNPVSRTSATSATLTSVTFTGVGACTFPGSAATAVATTNSSGIATSPICTAVARAGSYTGTATVVPQTGSPLIQDFSLTVTPGAAASIEVTPSSGSTPQHIPLTQPFPNNLSVTVTDASTNPVSGAVVTFSVPGSGASATLSSTTATTNSSGIAMVSATANSIVGTYDVSASVASVSTLAHFTLTNDPDQTITVVSGSPQTTTTLDLPTYTGRFASPLTVQLLVGGSPVPDGTVVTFSLPTAGASATFTGGVTTATANTTGGIATSPTITANSIGGTYNVTVTSPRAATITTALTNQPFTITEPSLMLQKTASGGTVSYVGTLTLNNVSTGAISVPPTFTVGGSNTFSQAGTCTVSPLAANSSCITTFTLTSSLPLAQSPAPVITVDGSAYGYGTLPIPVAAISVRPLSPPQYPTNNAALMLVAGGCLVPEVVEVTNLSNAEVANIKPTASGWTNSGTAIPRIPGFTNNCDGLSLSPAVSGVEGQSCGISVVPSGVSPSTTAAAQVGDTGVIAVNGAAGSGALAPVNIIAAVEAVNTSTLPAVGTLIPVTGGNETVISTSPTDRPSNTCNLVKVSAAVDQLPDPNPSPHSEYQTSWDDDTAETLLSTGAISASDGQTNTIKAIYTISGIKNQSLTTFAAGMCDSLDENDDVNWYLPSLSVTVLSPSTGTVDPYSELSLMITNTPDIIGNTGNAGNGWAYWSSTELSSQQAALTYWIPSGPYFAYYPPIGGLVKNGVAKCRCIRAMTY